eukprot:1196383-Prorocentrum_minimum.AAC.2
MEGRRERNANVEEVNVHTIALNVHTIALNVHTVALNVHTVALNVHTVALNGPQLPIVVTLTTRPQGQGTFLLLHQRGGCEKRPSGAGNGVGKWGAVYGRRHL